jgi:hypothetical protein
MNERIEHCLYKAGLTAQGCWEDLDTYTQEGIEKFAELIVLKCAEIAYTAEPFLASDLIKEHFGVEE